MRTHEERIKLEDNTFSIFRKIAIASIVTIVLYSCSPRETRKQYEIKVISTAERKVWRATYSNDSITYQPGDTVIMNQFELHNGKQSISNNPSIIIRRLQ